MFLQQASCTPSFGGLGLNTMFGRNKHKVFEEGFATGFNWGESVAYATIRMVLADRQRSFDDGGHPGTCKCKPCELIREILVATRVS